MIRILGDDKQSMELLNQTEGGTHESASPIVSVQNHDAYTRSG